MKIPYSGILCFCLLSLIPGMAAAEAVKIPVGQQAAGMRDMDVPRRGMNKTDVEAAYGAPRDRSRAVGEPPISYWEFEHYFVYFENDRVLHTVFKRTDSER